MSTGRTGQRQRFGGRWTQEKLAILERYLDAYTTALKAQPFSLMYIDAFAGTGEINTRAEDSDAESFLKGSAQIAIDVDEKPFDKLVFVENDVDKCKKLIQLKEKYISRRINVHQSDANDFLRRMSYDWQHWRGVLFLDPFATEVEWATIKAIAKTEALDMWLLFPVHAISRMLPTEKRPEDVQKKLADRLTRVFGGPGWRALYQSESGLFDFTLHTRKKGVEDLLGLYKKNLGKLFGERLLSESRTLRNSRNSVLFEFIFCAGNMRGKKLAFRIAKHLIKDLEISYFPPPRSCTIREGGLF